MINQQVKEQKNTFTLNSENFEQNWPILGLVDLEEILPENFLNTINYWSYLASRVIDTLKRKSNLNISTLVQVLQICRTSVLFSLFSLEREENCTNPISFLAGMEKPSSTVDQIDFPIIPNPEFSDSLNNFCEICKHLLKTDFTIEQVINCCIYLSLHELNFCDNSLFNHFNDICGCTLQIPDGEIQNILNFENVNSLLEALRKTRLKMNQPIFFILKFIYENLYNYQFNLSYIQDTFYKNLISKGLCDNEIDTIVYTCFSYIRGAPIQFEPSKIGKNITFFCYLCLNGLVSTETKETFFAQYSNELDPWAFFVYAFYNSIYAQDFVTSFLSFLSIKELNESWKSTINFISELKDVKANLEQYNSYANYIKSIFSLNNQIADNQQKDKTPPQIPEKINDDLTAPTLFWYNFHKEPIKVEVIIDLLKKLISFFQECLQKTVAQHPIFIHAEYLEFHSRHFPAFEPPSIPTKPEDFLTAPPPIPPTNYYVVVNLVLSQLIENSVQFKYEIPCDLLISFCTNSYIASETKDKIFKLNNSKLNDKVIESNNLHIDSIFNAPETNEDKLLCIELISPILSILPFSYKYIIRLLKSDDKYLPIINQIFAAPTFLKSINSLKQDEIETMLNCAIDRNLQNTAKYIINSIEDHNIIYSLISSIAFTKPSAALFLYKIVSKNIKVSPIVALISNKATSLFPSDFSIAIDFISFLATLSKSVPHVPFYYQSIIRSDSLSTTWEEDFVSKSNEVLTKAFINIWEFPLMTKDDIENEKQKILSSSNNSHHSHKEGDRLKNNSIFEKYCCTFREGIIEQPYFFCYTCGLFDRFLCCLGCAMTCHRGHDLVYVKNEEVQCDCYRIPRMCIFNPKQENLLNQEDITPPNIEITLEHLHQLMDEGGEISFHQRQLLSSLFNNERIQDVHPINPFLGIDGQNEDLEDENGIPVRNNANKNDKNNSKNIIVNKKNVLDLFLKVASIKMDEKIDNNINNIDDPKSFDLCWQEVVKVDRLVDFIPIETAKSLIDWSEMQRAYAENERATYIMQRCIVSPITVAAFASNDIIVCTNGKSLFSYRSSDLTKKLATIDIAGFITQINPCPANRSIIAVRALTQVYILKVNDDGTFSMQNDKIIKFLKIDSKNKENGADYDGNDYDEKNPEPSTFVLNVFWLNSNQSRIAVLQKDRMLLYDLQIDSENPYMTISSKGSEPFSSAVIVEHNNEDFAVLTLESGHYFVHSIPREISVNKDNGEQKVTTNNIVVSELFKFSWFPQKPVVAYCPSTELFFVISSENGIAILTKKDFFSRTPKKPFIINSSGAPSNLIFIGNHPKNPNFYIFFHIMSGGIVTLQLGRSKVYFSFNESKFDNYRFPILTKDSSPLSIFSGPSLIKDGSNQLYSISINGQMNEMVLLSSPSSSSLVLSGKRKKSSHKAPTPPFPRPPPSLSYYSRRDDEDSLYDNDNGNSNDYGNDNDNDDEEGLFASINESDDIDGGEPPSRYHEIFIRSLRSMLSEENNGSDDRNSSSELDPLNLKPQIKVPPLFWTSSRLSTDENLQIFIPNFDRNPRIILQTQKVIFDHSLRKKFIEVTYNSDTEVIVGFRCFVSTNSTSSHRPPYFSLNGRITKVDQPRWYMLPLAADEIEPRKSYRIEIGNKGGLDINCDGLGVFVIDKAQIEESINAQLKKLNLSPKEQLVTGKKHDWFFDSSSLFSFSDTATSYGIKKSNSSKESKNGNSTGNSNENNNNENSTGNSSNENSKENNNNNENSNNENNNNENNNNENNNNENNDTSNENTINSNENGKNESTALSLTNRNLTKILKRLSFMFSPVSQKPSSNNNNNDDTKNTNDNNNNNNNGDDDAVDKSGEDAAASGADSAPEDVDDSLDDDSIRELVKLIYTSKNASIPARRILLKIILGNSESKDKAKNDTVESDEAIFDKNKKLIDLWCDVIESLLKEKKVLPELWDVLLRDYSLMPKQEQSKIGDLLWESEPPKDNEFAFFSAFIS